MFIPKAGVDVTEGLVLDNYYQAEVTIFIAKGYNPDTGLDGTLAISILPDTTAYNSVSLIS